MQTTSSTDRAVAVDALRGFALWGILFANIYWFSFWPRIPLDERYSEYGQLAVEIVRGGHLIFIEGKFYTLFSLLFWLGFAIQVSRLEARHDQVVYRFTRRLFFLFLIGFVHLALFWEGDILTVYALCGLVLLPLRHVSDRGLILGAVGLILLPIVGTAVFRLNDWPIDLGLYAAADWVWSAMNGPDEVDDAELLRGDDLQSYLTYTLSGVPYRFALILETWRFPKIVGTMMLGIWLARRLNGGDFALGNRFLIRVGVGGSILGLIAGTPYYLLGGLYQEEPWRAVLAAAAHALSVTPLGLAYAAGFLLIFRLRRELVSWLAPMGRMALTNYLMQTVVCIFIFYGIGPALGRIQALSPHQFYAIAVALLATQAVLSAAWLRAFRMGPMEWLWRWGTYGSRPVLSAQR